MAQSLISYCKYFFRSQFALAMPALLWAHVALAQELPDPTRPVLIPAQANAGKESVSGPVLQSILIAPNRRVAIISGQTVALNGKYGDQTLIRMTETEVVLRNGKELQTLKLFPDVEKKMSSSGAGVKINPPRQ
jgi:MSHA biogenesis protein MshK